MSKQRGYVLLPLLILFAVASAGSLYAFKQLELSQLAQAAILRQQQQRSSLELALAQVLNVVPETCVYHNHNSTWAIEQPNQWWRSTAVCHINNALGKDSYIVEPLQSDTCVEHGKKISQYWRITLVSIERGKVLLQVSALMPRVASSGECRHYVNFSGPMVVSWQWW